MAVGATFHVLEGITSKEPIATWWSFERCSPICVRGASDGHHLIVDDDPPEHVDMGEAGELRFVDLSGASPFAALVGSRLVAAWMMASPPGDEPFGIRWELEEGFLRVFNWGDVMRLDTALPPDRGLDTYEERLLGSR